MMEMKIGIVGLGLIGGSLARAFSYLGYQVYGIDTNSQYVELAYREKVIVNNHSDLNLLTSCDVVFLATPPETTLQLIPALNFLKPETIITDTVSIKGEIMQTAREKLNNAKNFIGGHPLTGMERGGYQAGHRFLFENSYYFLIPGPDAPEDTVTKLKGLLEKIGALVIVSDVTTHDRITAQLSHLPHAIAYSLCRMCQKEEDNELLLKLAAGGFRDLTRIAASSPELWSEILLYNREEVAKSIDLFIGELLTLKNLLMAGNKNEISAFLKEGQEFRTNLNQNGKGYLLPLYDLTANIPDRPGMLAKVTGLLARFNINIKDIEILKAREGDGGVLKLSFATFEERQKAFSLLEKEGYRPVLR
ncbi:prephenate dehydrogenase [Carboxydothermus hydrogenoformans]|nr:prephenate dehydrogenase [Carboxydothermus hydrogenoformans]